MRPDRELEKIETERAAAWHSAMVSQLREEEMADRALGSMLAAAVGDAEAGLVEWEGTEQPERVDQIEPVLQAAALLRYMSLAVLGHWLAPSALAEAARADANRVHPNPECADACAAFVVAASSLVGGSSKADAVRAAMEWYETSA